MGHQFIVEAHTLSIYRIVEFTRYNLLSLCQQVLYKAQTKSPELEFNIIL